jgi:hypothetical protein
MKAVFLFLLFFCLQPVFQCQVNGTYIPGTPCSNCGSKSTPGLGIANGNAYIATNYTASACGLNYVQASLPLHQRQFVFGIGLPQPATFNISGIPPCATILRAFLYLGTVGNPATVITASLTNPVSTSSLFPMTMIGSDASVCWNTIATVAYRADVTALVSGNGNYILSGIPTDPGPDDPEGATLIIIYSDQSQTYTGNIVIADGCLTNTGNNADPYGNGITGTTINGFSVCASPALSSGFMILCDLQKIDSSKLFFNTPIVPNGFNYVKPMATDQVWDFVMAPGAPLAAGQTTADYGFKTSGDCVGLIAAGAYYRTACMNCPGLPPNMLTLTVTATTNSLCAASFSATTIGGSGSYNYYWSGSTQTGSVAMGLSAGVHTVIAYDANCLAAGITTILVTPSNLTLTATADPNCLATVSVSANGIGPSTYTWSGTAQTGSVAVGLSQGIHTVTVANGCGIGSTTVFVTPSVLALTVTTNPNCPTTASVFANGFGPYTYTWSGIAHNYSVIAALSPGIHTVTVANGCGVGSATVLASKASLTLIPTPSVTCAKTVSMSVLGGAGTYIYTWSGSPTTGSVASQLAPGIHTVTAVNNCGVGSTTILVTQATIAVTATVDPLCPATVSASAIGSPGPYSYTWSGSGQTGSVAVGLSPGIHTVTATDYCGSGSTTVFVTPGTLTITPVADPNCPTSVSINVIGGTGPYSYYSQNNSIFISNPATLYAGIFTISVMDNCFANTATVQVVPATLTLATTPDSVCPTTVSVTASGPIVGNVTYYWPGNPNQYGSVATGLSPGVQWVWATNVCGSGTASLLVTPAPLSLTVTPNPDCPTTLSVSVTGSPGPYTYNWSGSAQNSSVVTSMSVGLNSITVKTSCALGSTTVMVLPPTLTLNLLTTASCPVTATAIASGAGGPFTYTWSGTAQTGSVATSLGPNTYTVKVKNLNGCRTGSAVINVSAFPAGSISINVPPPVCSGNMAPLLAGPANSYTWSPIQYVMFPNNASTMAFPPATSIFTVTYSDAFGCIGTQTTQVTIANTQTFSMNDELACEGQTLTIYTALGGTSTVWNGPNNFTNAASPLVLNNVSPSMNGIYTTTVISLTGCSQLSTFNVSVMAAPMPTLGSNSPICAGNSLSLTSTANASSYSWSGPGGFSSNLQNPVISNAAIPSSGTYIQVVTYTNTCTRINSLSVTVNAIPQPSVITNSPVCENKTLTFNTTGGGGGAHQWTGPGGFSANFPNLVFPNIQLNAAGVYTLMVSVGNCSATIQQVVVVNPAPVINPLSNSPVCLTSSLQLTGGIGSNATYSWLGPNSFASNVANPVIASSQLINSGAYSLTATSLLGCQTTSVISVTVLPIPIVTSSSVAVCYGAPATLTATGAASYTWATPSGTGSTGSSLFITNANNLTSGTYTVTGQAMNTCTASTQVSIVVKPLPVLSVTGATVCETQGAGLNASGAQTYSWNGPSGFTSSLATILFPQVTSQATGVYTVIGTGLNSCTVSATATISVVPIPQISVTASPSIICAGESLTLTAAGAQTYSWLPLGSSNATVLVVSPSGPTVFSVLGSNMGLCNGQAGVTIFVNVCTGLKELVGTGSAILVYPNPASQSFVVKTETDMVLQLFNNLGQLIRVLELNQKNAREEHVSGIANGVYYLVSPNQAFRQKVLITR